GVDRAARVRGGGRRHCPRCPARPDRPGGRHPVTTPTETPATMPAAVLTGPAAFEVQDLPVPALGPDEVLVEVGWCGICGTDLHLALEGYGRPGTVLGHEWSG